MTSSTASREYENDLRVPLITGNIEGQLQDIADEVDGENDNIYMDCLA